MDDEKILIIDWKNKDGSGEYAIRYTLDMEKGNFIITGDVGYCIASWYNHLTPDILIGGILDSVHSVAGFQIEFIYGPQNFKWHGNNFLKILISDFTF